MAISGHHSEASLRNYIGRPSSEKIRASSDILSDKLSGKSHQSLQPSFAGLSSRAIFIVRWIRLSFIQKSLKKKNYYKLFPLNHYRALYLIIMLPVANEKQQGVSFNSRLQHVSVIIHFHRKLIKLRHTIVLYMLVNVTCNHSWRTLSWRRNASKEIIKKLHRQEVFLCAAHSSPLKQKN